MKIRFMCGCEHETDDFLGIVEIVIEDGEEIPVVSESTKLEKDDEGFLLCPQHLVRRAGWRSAGLKRFGWGLTPLQLEQAATGQMVDEGKPVQVHAPTSPDMRDNRDPLYMSEDTRKAINVIRAHRPPNGEVWSQETEREKAGTAARKRLDLMDRTGWPVYDAQPKPIWD